jgi:hypothetical protein
MSNRPLKFLRVFKHDGISWVYLKRPEKRNR